MQEVLAWRSEFELGLDEIDDTHRGFVALVSALQTANDGDLVERLSALRTHTQSHFAMEDEWMRATEFPPVGCHSGEHARVLAVFDSVLDCARQGDLKLARRLAEELTPWFEQHAATMDRMLVFWLKSKQAAPTSP